MAVTLTTNYQETLAPETITLIEKFEEDNYDLGAMLVFIDEYGEVTFQDDYELYVTLGEDYGFEAVDAWLTLNGSDDLDDFEEAYIGEFRSPSDMAQDYLEWEGQNVDCRIAIDWRETADNLLAHEVEQVGDFYFRCGY